MTALRALARTPLRPEPADLALAGVLALIAVLSLAGPPSVRTAVAGVAALVQVAALLFVRTSPTAVVVVFALTVPFAAGATGSAGWPLLAFLVGLHRGGPVVLAVAYVAGEIAAYTSTGWPDSVAVDLAWIGGAGLVVLLAWGLGRLRRAARDREHRRREAAEQARLGALVTAQRQRIAEDLNAVVLDELRRVAALAAGLRAAVAAGPVDPGSVGLGPVADPASAELRQAAGPADPALAELRQAARSALAAMRRVLTVLRSTDDDAVPPQDPPPPRWWEPRPPSMSGLVLALVIAAGVLGTAALQLTPTGDPAVDPLFAYLDLPARPSLVAVLAVQIAAVAWWRTWPVPALLVATAASGALALTGSAHFVAELSVYVLVYAVAAGVPPWVSGPTVLACTIVLAAEIPTSTPGRSPTAAEWAGGILGVVVLWLVGVFVRWARGHAERRRADRAAQRSRARLGDERLGIARELHDLVAHHASAVAVQASAARSNPATLPDAVTHIEQGGLRIAEAVRTLADLALPTLPAAPLSRAGVEELLGPARAAGLPVTAEVDGEPAAEPGEADLFAHRIVVEALTNVLRHAGPSATRLVVRHRPGEVVVEVRDSGVLPGHRTVTRGSGLGLVGMRERAALLGGEAEAGPNGEEAWVVRARLPRRGGGLRSNGT